MNTKSPDVQSASLDRRSFLCQSAAAALPVATATLATATLATAAEPQAARPAEFPRKIKLGVVGCGGRGSWIAGLFKKHGGYEMHAVADYFQDVADRCGDALGVDEAGGSPAFRATRS